MLGDFLGVFFLFGKCRGRSPDCKLSHNCLQLYTKAGKSGAPSKVLKVTEDQTADLKDLLSCFKADSHVTSLLALRHQH